MRCDILHLYLYGHFIFTLYTKEQLRKSGVTFVISYMYIKCGRHENTGLWRLNDLHTSVRFQNAIIEKHIL